ncbi:50S ribosomal protein L7/L12 [Streptococcus cristatus]|uniref:50S ribosomal protein L7/L12 n=1 Tax=Streptococcus cristatus TaxID=45634 RepID=UPI0028D3432A|nr:50S ribosomal protein L7/L12 [Streptococcus cristatus]
MLDICIDAIANKSLTYKILRKYSALPFSQLKLRIENHDPVMVVDDLKLDELRRVRELIYELSGIGTEVTIKDSTGIITLGVLHNIISSYEGITADIEELDALVLDEEE